MKYSGRTQKSFLQSFTWVGIMLLVMGAVFLSVAAVMQLVPISPGGVTVHINGVRQPATAETVRLFRLLFLVIFGVIGLLLAIAGSIVIGRERAQLRLIRRLKEEGVRLSAEAVELSPSYVRINFRYLMRLHCAYTGSDGITCIFKSGLLRMNPMPYLRQNRVYVYHDRNDMSLYFVDVDGSAGLNTTTVEL